MLNDKNEGEEDDEEESPPVTSFFQELLNKFAFMFGLFVIVWLILAKNLPSIFLPHHDSNPAAFKTPVSNDMESASRRQGPRPLKHPAQDRGAVPAEAGNASVPAEAKQEAAPQTSPEAPQQNPSERMAAQPPETTAEKTPKKTPEKTAEATPAAMAGAPAESAGPAAAPVSGDIPATTPAALPPAPPAAVASPAQPMPDPRVAELSHAAELNKEYIAHLEDKVASLQKQLATIQTQLSERSDAAKKQDLAMDEKLQQQEKSMESLKAKVIEMQAGNARQLTSVTAFSIMKEAALRGEPFETEFRQVAELASDPRQKMQLAALEPYAEKGIGSLPALKNQFDSTLPRALAPERKEHTLAASLQSLIQIRKEGEQQQGMDDESVLARAEAKIHRGEVAAAIKELQALSPPATDVFSGWLREAQAYIDGRNALDALQLALLKGKTQAMPETSAAPAKAAAKPAPATAPAAVQPAQEAKQPPEHKTEEKKEEKQPDAANAPAADKAAPEPTDNPGEQ